MTRSAIAVLTLVLLPWAIGAISMLKAARDDDVVVGGVHVMPPDFEDPYRSRTPLALFAPGMAPGDRVSTLSTGRGVPSFNAVSPESTPEAFVQTPKFDPIGMMCSPGGRAYGHYFYNVVDPEVVPFIVPKDQPGRTDMAVVVAPGGGHLHLAWEPSGVGPAEWLNSIGVSAFVLKYRVPDFTNKVQVMDVQRAMSLVRHNAADYGVNASRIGFMGSSASGELALRVATTDERLYSRIDDIDDVPYKPDFLILMFPGNSNFMTPELAAKMPTTFLTHAKDDPCVADSMMTSLASLLQKYSSKPFLYHDYEKGRHGWATCEYYPDTLMKMEMCNYKQLAEPFLHEHVLGV